MATARGQITITDLNDARQTSFYLDPSLKSRTQVYNKSGMTYQPDYTNSNSHQVITPVLYVTGSTDNQMTNASAAPTWTVYSNGTKIFCNSSDTTKALANLNYEVGTAQPFALTIKQNIPDDQLDIDCETSYFDSSIKMSIPQTAHITLTKNVNNGTLAFADIRPSCEVFLNNSTPASITLTPILNRGGAEDTTPGESDDGTFTVQWYKDGTADGNKVTTAKGIYEIDATSGVLTVYPDGVDNVNTFFAKITDTNKSSATKGKTYIAAQTLTDLTDPYHVEITSNRGFVFRNGQGSNIVLTAALKQGANDVPGKVASYSWKVVEANGANVDLTGKTTNTQTFTVEPSMVSGSAMVECAITIK